jgi:hypothetical protein
MAEITMFPYRSTEPYDFLPQLAAQGYWVSCLSCKRQCFRAGCNFVACTAHSGYDQGNTQHNEALSLINHYGGDTHS